jgi:hypothetical protein
MESGMAHLDLDRLLDLSVRFTQEMLKRRGPFLPFAVTVNTGGGLAPVAIQPEADAPKPQDLIDRLSRLLRALDSNGEATETSS